jgi:hypothetical protein
MVFMSFFEGLVLTVSIGFKPEQWKEMKKRIKQETVICASRIYFEFKRALLVCISKNS